MNLNEYQTAAAETAVYPRNGNNALIYTALGLASEAGEVAGKVKKMIRDNVWQRDAVKAELGDVLWYVAAMASEVGFTLEDVAQANIDKLTDRKRRDRLRGDGDYR